MKIVISDDYQDAIRKLPCFSKLAGHEVVIHNDTVHDLDGLAARFQDAEAIVLIRERTRMPRSLIERLPKLRLISQTAKPGPHIDVAACTERGVAVAGGAGGPQSTAELTWALILAASRHVALEDRRVRDGRWQTTIGIGMYQRTLGIYGYGNIGKLVAKVGSAFGMRVLVWGREGSLQRAAADGLACAPGREAFFAESDVLSLHIRLTPETRGLITAADLARMKPDAMFVNTSRAELVVSGALAAALERGRPGQAGIDVFENEPVLGATDPLMKMDNVVCTPHLGYVEARNYERYFSTAFDNVLAFAAGKPTNVVNPEVL